jgi:hypothetical protein
VSNLPPFDADGLLPAGDYELTFAQLRRSALVVGPQMADVVWDAIWRETLVKNLEIDGYFVCTLSDLTSGELTRQLNLLDPYEVWTWDPNSRLSFRGYPKKQLPMWHRYRIELYPHIAGFFSGIRDVQGQELEFPSAFRQSRRDGKPRGIIKLKSGES